MESFIKYENSWHSKKTVDKLLEKTSPGALEPKKSLSSLRRYELFKGLRERAGLKRITGSVQKKDIHIPWNWRRIYSL